MIDLIQEPLDELATLAWDAAPQLCHSTHGCQSYHRAWSTIRLLSGHANQLAGQEFFRNEIARLAQNQKRLRVLVSGGADAAITIAAINACRLADIEVEIVFVDRCATPCSQNRWLAEFYGLELEVMESDILKIEIEPVDLVIAHNFLPFFDLQGRSQVLNTWKLNCKLNGTLLLSNTLVLNEKDWIAALDTDAVKRRSQDIFNQAVQAGSTTQTAAAMASAALDLWSSHTFTMPPMTEQGITEGLDVAGFQVKSIVQRDLGSASRAMGAIRGLAQRTRAEICAVRVR